VLPGAAVVAALFPRRGLSRLERSVLAVALSLATLVLGGLVLDVLAVRLTSRAWAALVGGVTVGGAFVAYLRTFRHARVSSPGSPRLGRWVAPLALALVLLGGAGWLSLATAARQAAATHVTALSIRDSFDWDSTTDRRLVTVEVTNQEATPVRYTLT